MHSSPSEFARRIKYFNNCLFHNVQPNFIVQSGDPTGTGKGGESIYGCGCEARVRSLRVVIHGRGFAPDKH